MPNIPDSIIQDLSGEELKFYLTLRQLMESDGGVDLNHLIENTGLDSIDEINSVFNGLVEKNILAFGYSEQGDKPQRMRWYNPKVISREDKRQISSITKRFREVIAFSKFSFSKTGQLFVRDLDSGDSAPVLRAGFYPNAKKIKEKKRTKKKENKKKYIFIVCIIYKENKRYYIHHQGYNLISKSANKLISLSESSPASLKKSKLLVIPSPESDIEKAENSQKSTTSLFRLSLFLKTGQLKAKTRQANQLVSYFSDKIYSISGGAIKLSNTWYHKQRSSAKRLLNDYPDIPFEEWFEIMDFFFDDDFWCDKIINFIQLETHLPKYQIAKAKKKPRKKKKSKRLENKKILK